MGSPAGRIETHLREVCLKNRTTLRIFSMPREACLRVLTFQFYLHFFLFLTSSQAGSQSVGTKIYVIWEICITICTGRSPPPPTILIISVGPSALGCIDIFMAWYNA